MCGLAGLAGAPGEAPPIEALAAMAEAMRHRGPDDDGVHVDAAAGIGLAHRRLSIIDLSAAGRQPLHSTSGRVLIYNGEVYNFRALRAELERLGHAFVSRTDSEVVLRAWDAWGPACLERFAGMFALALWSPDERTLWLARDPAGMKPLYYTTLADGRLAFASEVKAFLALPGFRARVDPASLREYVELGYVYDTRATSLLGVFKLPPGHRLAVRAGRPGTPEPFFRAPRPDPGDERSVAERADELHALLREVVAQHLVADVPLGLMLSGGLDSSLLAALAAREAPLVTLTMGFARSRVDERRPARRVAEHVGARHLELLLEPSELVAGLDEGVACVDDLFGDWGVVTTRLLYRRAREQGLKVVLVGEGADEVFGGYPPFAYAPGPLLVPRLYRKYAGRRYGRGFLRFRRAFQPGLDEAGGDAFHAVRLFELRHQLPNNYVMKVDKASMSVSVEARAPWLDPRVLALGLRTPKSALLRAGETKHLLRELGRRARLLPEELCARPKFGAAIASSWLLEAPELRARARDVVLARGGWAEALGLREPMLRFFDHGQAGYAFPRALSLFDALAWRLLLLGSWSRRVLGRDGREALAA